MTVVLPPSLEESLRRYAAERGVGVEAVVGEALRVFLGDRPGECAHLKNDRYPLRGSVLRFDGPFEPSLPETEWGGGG